MCQCTLFDVGGVEIHSIECIEYCTKDQSNVEDVALSGQQTLVELHASRTNKDVCMYT